MDQIAEPEWRTKRREKIVCVASRLFAKTPFERVQMDDLAATAGISKATLYRYFPSKDELYLEICERTFKALDDELVIVAELPPAQALRGTIAALVDVLASQVGSLRLLSGERSPVADGWRDLYHEKRRAIVAVFRRVLERGIEQGEFREIDVELVPTLIVGMVRGGLVHGPPANREHLVDTLMDVLLNGSLSAKAADGDIPGARTKRSCTRRPAA
jgi:AcrR family transcriptional regulator